MRYLCDPITARNIAHEIHNLGAFVEATRKAQDKHDRLRFPRDRKSVEWSYPTSPNAVRFGFAKVGCWTLELVDSAGNETPMPVSGHATKDQALEASRDWPQAWADFFLRFNPPSVA